MTAAVVLTASRFHFSTGEYHDWVPDLRKGNAYAAVATHLHLTRLAAWLVHATSSTGDHLYWFLGSFAAFFVAPALVGAVVPGIALRDLGMGAGDWRYGLRAVAILYSVMLPFVVVASFMPAFANAYPLSGGAHDSWQALIVYEAAYTAYFIGWEFTYRGLLCVGLYPRIGAAAILLQTITFGVMHAGKPEPEAFGAIIAGVALGVVAVRARSFWYGAMLHALVAMTMDALALGHGHRWPVSW
jgi:hypothetical protein